MDFDLHVIPLAMNGKDVDAELEPGRLLDHVASDGNLSTSEVVIDFRQGKVEVVV